MAMNEVQLRITYGSEDLWFRVPEKNFCYYVEPRVVSCMENESEGLLFALQHPIGSPPLAEIIKPGMKILIITDDNTRPTPKKRILPILIEELCRCGIDERDIIILIALGTHRYMSQAEIRETFGDALVNRIRIVNHEWDDPEQLVPLGYTPAGTKIVVNKKVCEADFVIGVGSIVPHSEAGWSGGGKIIQPGICGWETTAATHLLAARSQDYLRIAGVVDNPVRREIESIARRVGLKFVLNVVMGAKNKIYQAVCGDPVAAHRLGVAQAKNVYECEIPRLADTVIVSAYPADLDYWQGDKPVTYALRGIKQGGTIILVGRFPEGVSGSHPVMEKYGRCSYQQLSKLAQANIIDDQVGLSALFIHAHHKEKASVICVSDGLTLQQKENLGFIHADSIEHAIRISYALQGENSKIGVIDYGGDLLPVFKG